VLGIVQTRKVPEFQTKEFWAWKVREKVLVVLENCGKWDVVIIAVLEFLPRCM